MNLGNMGQLLKLKAMWDKFTRNHPKFPQFINVIKKRGITEGTVIDVTITYPDSDPVECNLKITDKDLELFEALKKMGMQQQ